MVGDEKKRDVAKIETLTEICPKEQNYEKLETLRNLEIRIITKDDVVHTIVFFKAAEEIIPTRKLFRKN